MAHISSCLTHWVGRDQPDDEKYRILTDCILRNRELLYSCCPWDFRAKYGGMTEDSTFEIPMICFTDIPFSECQHHCQEYSQFGVSFDKSYLVNCLASPVGYAINPFVFQNYSFINLRLSGMSGLLDGTIIPKGKHKGKVFNVAEILGRFHYICAFMKNYSKREFIFNENRPEPHCGNEDFFQDESAFYYEREWRMCPSTGAQDLCWNAHRDGQTYFTFNEEYLKYVILPRSHVAKVRERQSAVFEHYGHTPTILAFEDLKGF